MLRNKNSIKMSKITNAKQAGDVERWWNDLLVESGGEGQNDDRP